MIPTNAIRSLPPSQPVITPAALSKEAIREKIMRDGLVKIFSENSQYLHDFKDLTIEDLYPIMLGEFLMHLSEKKKLVNSTLSLLVKGFSPIQSEIKEFYSELEYVDNKVKKTQDDDAKYCARLSLIKRIHCVLHTPLGKQKVSEFLNDPLEVNTKDVFIRICQVTKFIQDYSFSVRQNTRKNWLTGVKTIHSDADFAESDLLFLGGVFTFFVYAQQNLQVLVDSQDPLKILSLMKLLHSSLQNCSNLKELSLDPIHKKTMYQMKSKRAELMSQRSQLNTKQQNILLVADKTLPFYCATLNISQSESLYKKIEAILKFYIQKYEVIHKELIGDDTDILTVVDELKSSRDAKTKDPLYKNESPQVFQKKGKNKKLNSNNSDSSAEGKKNIVQRFVKSKTIESSTTPTTTMPSSFNSRQILSSHLEELEVVLRNQAILGLKADR